MTEKTAEAIGSLILARQEYACVRLDEDAKYKFLGGRENGVRL